MSNGTCFPGVSCLNVGVGQSKCGPCPKGYEGDGRTCTDINEVGRVSLAQLKLCFCLCEVVSFACLFVYFFVCVSFVLLLLLLLLLF